MQETQETQVQSLSWEDSLQESMAPHSSIPARRIPWTEEPGRLHSPWGDKELDCTHTRSVSKGVCAIFWAISQAVGNVCVTHGWTGCHMASVPHLLAQMDYLTFFFNLSLLNKKK